MTYEKHTRFPFKKCIIASIVLLIVASMVLTLLVSITKNQPDDRLGFILLVVFLSLFSALLVGYWVYQIVRYIRTRKDEK